MEVNLENDITKRNPDAIGLESNMYSGLEYNKYIYNGTSIYKTVEKGPAIPQMLRQNLDKMANKEIRITTKT